MSIQLIRYQIPEITSVNISNDIVTSMINSVCEILAFEEEKRINNLIENIYNSENVKLLDNEIIIEEGKEYLELFENESNFDFRYLSKSIFKPKNKKDKHCKELILEKKKKILYRNWKGFKDRIICNYFDNVVVFFPGYEGMSKQIDIEFEDEIIEGISKLSRMNCLHCEKDISNWFKKFLNDRLLIRKKRDDNLFDEIRSSNEVNCPFCDSKIKLNQLNENLKLNKNFRLVLSNLYIEIPKLQSDYWELIRKIMERNIGSYLIEDDYYIL